MLTIDDAIHIYRRRRWRLRPDLYRSTKEPPPSSRVGAPIFFVGLQGGGLTLLGRIVRRHDSIVTIGGGPEYWTGPDEMHTALHGFFPDELRLHHRHIHQDFAPLGRNVGWAFAAKPLLDEYRLTAADVAGLPHVASRLRRAVWATCRLNKPRGMPLSHVRLFDKSQTFGLKIPFIREALREWEPRFVGFTRDPWASCWRAATKADLANTSLPLEKRIRLAAEHWFGLTSALVDQENHEDMCLMRIEDVLADFPISLGRAFTHVSLPLRDSLLPSPDDVLPRGTRRRERWWPIRTDINSRYRDEIPAGASDQISLVCGSLANDLGYEGPL